MIRATIDTNIIVSGLFWAGLPGQVFAAAQNEEFISLLTEALVAELATVLAREKFAVQLLKRQKTVESVIQEYRSAGEIVEPAQIPADAVRDPKDRMVLACAVGGKADYIVSGDKDLLVLGAYEKIPILSADQFLQQLASDTSST